METTLAGRLSALTAMLVAAATQSGCTHTEFRDAIEMPTEPAAALLATPAVLAVSAGYAAVMVPATLVGTAVVPFVEVNERERMAAKARNEAAWGPAAHAVDASTAVIASELIFHLPPSKAATVAAKRVSITSKSGWFGRKTYHVVVVADFTPGRLKKFLEATRRLHGHLEPAPKLHLEVLQEAEAGATSLGVFEFS